VSAPAHAGKLNYKTPAELRSVCTQGGGEFLDLGHGDSICVFPDGRHLICFASTNQCVYVYVWAPQTGGRDLSWPQDFVLTDATSAATPPGPGYYLVPNAGTLIGR
jgi:hypothetical protein